MANAIDMMVPLLREIRSENAGLHEQTRLLISALDKRLGRVDGAQKSYSAALSADTLLSRLVAGKFEERIEALERNVQELEAQK
jgi:polyhydroxyalkanoate synthesis regulator phasin